ncbi:MAG: hypothetical protein M3R08_00245, partial [Bacteroidota bacterium]|nr:hypothetical protein [Bacteroidota bacterium]
MLRLKAQGSLLLVFILWIISLNTYAQPTYFEEEFSFSRQLDEVPFSYPYAPLAITTHSYLWNWQGIPDPCPQSRPNGSTLKVALSTGPNHDYGQHVFSAELKVLIRIIEVINGPAVLAEFTRTLSINEENPEHVLSLDLSAYQATMYSISVQRVEEQTVNQIHPSRIHFNSTLIVQRSLDIPPIFSGVTYPPAAINGSSVNFSWSNDQCGFPRYQLQLLRLFNNMLAPNLTEETLISADIDWSQAATFDLQAPVHDIDLTLTEGRGFYAWRVREMTDYHPGGFTNPNNWGPWSPHVSGILSTVITANPGIELVRGTSPNLNGVFYYDQFDADRNWNYERTFTEGTFLGMSSIPHRTSEKLTYATGLLQVEQEQTLTTENPQLIAGQIVQDLSGRPAVSSLPVPVAGQTTFGYVEDLLDPLEGPGPQVVNAYGPANFDQDDNYLINAEIGNAGNNYIYYSNGNSAEPEVPSAEGYPFSRSLFHRDGRVKETSAPGISFAFDGAGDDPKSAVTYYT